MVDPLSYDMKVLISTYFRGIRANGFFNQTRNERAKEEKKEGRKEKKGQRSVGTKERRNNRRKE